MRSNILPFGIIAIVGILASIIVYYVGVHQKAEIQQDMLAGDAAVEEVGEVAAPDEIYANSCAGCHGADLSGGFGPDLQNAGSKFAADEITDIILNGIGQMPAQSLTQEEADSLAEWFANN